MADGLLLIVRGAVALGCGAAGLVALTHWLVRRGVLSPFGVIARWVRRGGTPLLQPVVRQLVRRGGNPQDAPYWAFGVALVAGLALVSFTQWAVGYADLLTAVIEGGPAAIIAFLVRSTCDLLVLALFVRAIGSWFGIGYWTPWMRPFHLATDWLVKPLARVVPSVGIFDITPVVAWLILSLILCPVLTRLLAHL